MASFGNVKTAQQILDLLSEDKPLTISLLRDIVTTIMMGGYIPIWSSANGMSALPGGGQANAIPISNGINRFTTVLTAGDSGKLPHATSGMQITVSNAAAANAMNVFPQSGEQINALGANAAFSLAAGKTVQFSGVPGGQWHANLSA